MNQADLWKRVKRAKQWSHRAGVVLNEFFGAVTRVKNKGAVDLVTEADEAAEALLLSSITEEFPEDSILAEEAGSHHHGTSPWWWVVDPLDGTTNFVHGVSRFAVSIGITYDGKPVGGVVHDPCSLKTYHAAEGQGAWCESERLRVSETMSMGESLLVTGFPYDRADCARELVAPLVRALERARGVRRFGSACLDLVDVARGTIDGYWEPRLHPWDMAAGVLLVREAGGQVSRYGDAEFDLNSPDLIASNRRIHGALVELVGSEPA